MFRSLKKKLLEAAQATVPEFACPKCGQLFKPLTGLEIASFSDLAGKSTCPGCGAKFTTRELMRMQSEFQANPRGPFAKPADSRIEKRNESASELLFHIPASGRWGGWLFIAIFWNLISLPLAVIFIYSALAKGGPLGGAVMASFFGAIGIGFAYLALRTRFANHLLCLNATRVRLKRELLGWEKSHDLDTANIESVKKAEFYRQNYEPIFGIEIKAGGRRIRFGTILRDEEKNWLCWEIREFLRPYAPSLAP